jgi:predicted DNA-binding transcriptional regulator AlpA
VATEGVEAGILPSGRSTEQLNAAARPDPSPIEPASLAAALVELAKLPSLLVRLTAALDRQAAAALVEPLLSRRDVARALKVSLSIIDRLKAAGRLPRPDLVLSSRCPRWRASTIRAYLERGGRP